MLQRDACERRVYRLAVLLTGNPIAAVGVIESVVGAQPDLRKLDSDHLDRLTVLRSREIPPSVIANDRVTVSTAEAVASLSAQQREAWVFRRVYQMPPRSMARAMDCSVTATERHLQSADDVIERLVKCDSVIPADELRRYSMSLEVPEFFRAQQRRRRRYRIMWRVAVVLLILTGVIIVTILLSSRVL